MAISIRRTDFYFGAFLSVILERGLSIRLKDIDKRNLFEIEGEVKSTVYLKYTTTYNEESSQWTINFTENDYETIVMEAGLENKAENEFFYIGMVLTNTETWEKDTEIIILTKEELDACLDSKPAKGRSKKISINKELGSPHLRIHRIKNKEDEKNLIDRKRVLYLGRNPKDISEIWNI